MLPAPLHALLAHQGEELVFILPAAILLGTWVIAVWPSKAKPSKDSLAPHREDPETPSTEKAEPPGGT